MRLPVVSLAVTLVASCTGDIMGESDLAEPGVTPPGAVQPAPQIPMPAPMPGMPPAAGPETEGPVVIPPAAPKDDSVAPGSVRLLSTQELGNAFEALLRYRPQNLGRLPLDGRGHLFDRVVEDQTISLAHVEAFTAIADEIADWLTPQQLGTLVRACATTQPLGTDGEALARSRRPCVQKLIEEVGRRAFRRTVDPAKVTAWLARYDAAGTHADGLRQVVHAIFGAPEFLYVIETGKPVPGKPGVFALTDEEIATRLSLFLCETIPDSTLLAAAQAGALNQPDQIAAQAARLFDQTCAQRTVGKFFSQWFRTERVLSATRDTKLFPQFNEQARGGIVSEQDELTKHILWTMKGRLADFFTADFAFVHYTSAPIYGVTVPFGKMERVEMPPHRRGILSRPLFMVSTTTSSFTSPIVRGVAVLEKVLCQHLPPPPANVPQKPDDGTTPPRAQVEQHASDPACAGCHRIIDPVGFALEDFDAIGRHRTMDRGKPINAVGGIPSLGIENGKLEGAARLSAAVAGLKELRECFATQWFRFGMGRLEGQQDVKSLWEVADLLRQENVTLKDAMIGLARTYGFRHRAVSR